MLTIANTNHLIRTFLGFGIVSLLAIVFISVYPERLPENQAAAFFIIGISIVLIVFPLIALAIYYFKLTDKVEPEFHQDDVSFSNGISIRYVDIKSTDQLVNRNGYSNSYVIKLKNGKKYSISTRNRFSRESQSKFENLVGTVELKSSELQVN